MKVRERMSPAPVVCRCDEGLDAVVRRMASTELRALPVVDGRGALAGVVTERDVALAALRRRARLDELRAADAMREATTCGPEDDLWLAAELMRSARSRRLAVVGRDLRPLGVLTVADLARHAASGPARDVDDLGMDDVVELLVRLERAAPLEARLAAAAQRVEVETPVRELVPAPRRENGPRRLREFRRAPGAALAR